MYVQIYTDGACSGNPGPGGWAAIIIIKGEIIKIHGYEGNTTNNRMELIAPLKALYYIQNTSKSTQIKRIDIYSDSAYVVNSINMKWLNKWYLTNWTSSTGTKIKNVDLWYKIYNILQEINCDINFIKVKGHSGNLLNEAVDKIAKQMINEYLEYHSDTQE